ncbi:MAG: 4-(cytidine 5'-diphospho)-2-C-methyl-D-erythritol kinase [Chloroflexota bacterium]|nr:4-(cytidine 5'-diphospho)-2-C-methyl-D-erythritol kinase [Chloroflexota bacterium]
MRRVTRAAPAKVNLGLQITGRRPDGYHELVSVMQTLELADEVSVESAPTVSGRPSLPGLAAEDDLALRAAHLLRGALGVTFGAHVSVDKRIPAAAGLGGGSSDAAAVLMALNRLWGTNVDRERLLQVAAELGSDVPFLVRGGTALATGRGEHLRDLPPAPMRHVVLVRPDIALATADVYAELRPSEWSDGSQTRALADAIADGCLPADLLSNDLTAAAIRLAPVVGEILDELRAAGAQPALMAGSGATCFGLFGDISTAEQAVARGQAAGHWTHLTRFRAAAEA